MVDRLLFRTRAQAANANRRVALDLRFADRLERQGIRAYKSAASEHDVDLATLGGLSEPRGRPLINCVLFGSQSIRQVVAIRRELSTFETQHGRSDNIAFITIRPSRDLCDAQASKGEQANERLLDVRGRTPVKNLRKVHCQTNEAIQGAFEYMAHAGWLTPFAIGRHWDAIDGGAFFDWHAHITVEIEPEFLTKISAYLRQRFGADRIWISSEEEPNKRRDLVNSACYPAAKAANRGFEDVADEFLAEFFRQSAGLRRIEIAGPVRAARKAKRSTAPADYAREGGPDEELSAIEAEVSEMLDAMAVDEAASSEPSNEFIDLDPSTSNPSDGAGASAGANGVGKPGGADEAIVISCHFAFIGLSLRWVARVANYRGWDDLTSRVDLSADIAHAQRLAARAEHILFLSPVTPESDHDESMEFDSLAEWKSLRRVDPGTVMSGGETVGTADAVRRPTAEPLQGGAGPETVMSGGETVGTAGAARRPTAEPLQGGAGPETVTSGGETVGTAGAARRPTAEPLQGGADPGTVMSGGDTVGTAGAARRPTAEPLQGGAGPETVMSGGEPVGTAGAARRPTAEPQQGGAGPETVMSGGEPVGTAGAARRPTAEPQQGGAGAEAVVSGGETVGTADAVRRPTAEPLQGGAGAEAVMSGGETVGTADAVRRPTAEPLQGGADPGTVMSGGETVGTADAVRRPTAEPLQGGAGPEAVVSGSETVDTAGEGLRPTPGRLSDGRAINVNPATPKSVSAPTVSNNEISLPGHAGFTFELTVRAENGPATAVLRVRLPPSSAREEQSELTRIAG